MERLERFDYFKKTVMEENNFTERQFESAQALITVLSRFNPEIVKLSGHRDYANKDCPCFKVKDYLHL